MDKLVHAVQHGDFPFVENCLESQSFSADAVDDESCSLLHWASINNRFEIVKYLLGKHANVNIVGGVNSEIPIQWAIRHPRSLRLVSLLLDAGSNFQHTSVYGCDALFIAIQEGKVNIAFLLLHKGANPNIVDSNGDTPLLWLVKNENAVERQKLIRLLISFHANVGATTREGDNVLHLLIMKEHGYFDFMLAAEFYKAARHILMAAKNKEGLDPLQTAYKFKCSLALSFFTDAWMHSTLPQWTTIATTAVAVVLVFVIFHFFGLLWGSGLLVPLYFAWQSTAQQTIVNSQSRWQCGWAWGVIITIVSSYFLFLSLDVHYLFTTYFTANVLVICCSLYLTSTTEPANVSHMGESPAAREQLIAKMLQAEEQMEVDPTKHVDVSMCPTCLVDKSLASLHCSKCDLCVVNLDHHCPFVCNCVGTGNRLLFVWFTGSASLGCAFFAALSFYLQYTRYCPDAKGMLGSFFAVESCMLSVRPTLMCVTFLSLAVSIWIFCLFIGQMNMVAMETTTFQIIRFDNKGTESLCSSRAARNVARFCSTGEYCITVSPKVKAALAKGEQPGNKCKSCDHDHSHSHGHSSTVV